MKKISIKEFQKKTKLHYPSRIEATKKRDLKFHSRKVSIKPLVKPS